MAKPQSILITGGTGFLGKAVVKQLRKSSTPYEIIPLAGKSQWDLTKQRYVDYALKEFEPDIVVHLAARVGGIGANKENPGLFMYETLAMVMNLIESFRKYNKLKKFVMVGTVCSYPKFTPVPFKEEDMWNGYPEETEWELNDPDAGESVVLTVRYSFTCEDSNDPDSFESFCDYIEDDMDKNYDEIVEGVRRKLVSEGYALASEWDNLQSEIENMEDELEHFSVIADDPENPSGEAWFSLKDNERHGDTDVLLKVEYPGAAIYWLSKHPRMNLSAVSRRAGRIGMFRAMMVGTIQGHNRVLVGPETSSPFHRYFADKLRKLEDAANKYALTQLHLDFGEKFKQQKYEGIQFAKNTEMAVVLGGKESEPEETVPIFFRLKIIAGQKNTKEELEGAFHFIKFVDKHYDMIMQAANESMQDIMGVNLEIAEEYKEWYLSGTYAKELTDKIRSATESFSPIDVRAPIGSDPYAKRTLARKQHATLDFFEVRWPKFTLFEKEVAIDKYLKPMEKAPVGDQENRGEWDQHSHIPYSWARNVQQWMRDAGVSFNITNKYTIEAAAAPEITEKYFGEDRRAQDKIIKDKERQSGLMAQDAEINEPPEGLRGTIGKPVNLSESLQEQIVRLRSHLTETQIRVTIRQVLKKHGVT